MPARITLDIKTGGAGAAIKRLRKVTGDDARLALLDVGEYLLGSTQLRALRKVDPDGHAWAALSPRYKQRKDKLRPGVPILKFDGHMLGDRLAYQVENAVLLLGTSAPYGATQQFGRGKIPARPWLGLSPEDEDEVLAILTSHLEAALAAP